MPTVRDLQTASGCGLRSHYNQDYVLNGVGPDVKAEITNQLIHATYCPGLKTAVSSEFLDEDRALIGGIAEHYTVWTQQLFPSYMPLLDMEDVYPAVVRRTYAAVDVEANSHGYVMYKNVPHLLKFIVTTNFSDESFSGYGMSDLESRWMLYQTGLENILYIFVRKKLPAIPEPLKTGGVTKRKNIDTTHRVYQDELTRLGLNTYDYAEILSILGSKGNTFFSLQPMHWSRAATSRANTDVAELTSAWWDTEPRPSPQMCFTCFFRGPCRLVHNGQSLDIINSLGEYRKRGTVPVQLDVEL